MKPFIRATLVALALAASGATAQAADPIKLGATLSITGPAAFLGEPELKTLQLYVDKVNAEGGLLGRPIELISYDDGSEPGKANSFAKRLIEDDHVDAIIGGTTTGASMGMYSAGRPRGNPVHFARRRRRHRRAGQEMDVQGRPQRPYGGRAGVRRHQEARPDQDRAALRDLRLRPVRPQGNARGGAEGGHRDRRRRDLRRQGHRRHRPARPRSARSTASRRSSCSVSARARRSWPRTSRSSASSCRSISRTASRARNSSGSPAARRRACGCPRRRFSSPTSCPTAIRRRRSSRTTSRFYTSQDGPRRLDLRRPCARRLLHLEGARSSGPVRSTRPRCATRSRRPRASPAPAASST